MALRRANPKSCCCKDSGQLSVKSDHVGSRSKMRVMVLGRSLFTTYCFRFASLPDVEKDSVYSMDPDAALKYGGTLPDQFMDFRQLAYPPFKPKPFAQLKNLC